jgi:poly-gamma-glutamate capsule biosynthesis protein CapA/YwtB (metallophosphatase superfamily)
MRLGRVYAWRPDRRLPLGGRVEQAVLPLADLASAPDGTLTLSGPLIRVRNAGVINEPRPSGDSWQAVPIGDARPDLDGDFLFEPGRGGGRVDKVAVADPDVRRRYIQSSHFGEVNTYYHLNLIATYVDTLLEELSARRLPRVTAVVNAHHAATESDGIRDGVRGTNRWLPFQGGHYRLPSRTGRGAEWDPIQPDGEIHVGPGWRLLHAGALVDLAGGPYRANASHNAGILYHEYGHHITRHTADLRANRLREPARQDNRKAALDEGMCDYWTATMLDTPHIWAWHRRHDRDEMHPRSLCSAKTFDDFNPAPSADPHANGTVWGAALWDLRAALNTRDGAVGVRRADLMVLKTLLLLGDIGAAGRAADRTDVPAIRRTRSDYARALAALLRADEALFAARHRATILECFARRKIHPAEPAVAAPSVSVSMTTVSRALPRIAPDQYPANEDLFSAEALREYLDRHGEPAPSVLSVGDIMLGDRAKKAIDREGPDYPFREMMPLLGSSAMVVGNLEGPFARSTRKEERTYSYRVDPALASALRGANIAVVTLANNHLTDCGRAGVLETLEVLADAGVAVVGAGVNERAAHQPFIGQVGPLRVGLLGYYWNRRTAAGAQLAGSARDTREDLVADIGALRQQVDRVVVHFHWGIPYQRDPLPEDREKARFAVDCGADVVIGHHPHVVQPFEVYRGRPIFYSVGNFTFGSGNSQAEGLIVGCRFLADETVASVYPIYVKNRDPRVNYQPKLLRGAAARRALQHLVDISGVHGSRLALQDAHAVVRAPYLDVHSGERCAAAR